MCLFDPLASGWARPDSYGARNQVRTAVQAAVCLSARVLQVHFVVWPVTERVGLYRSRPVVYEQQHWFVRHLVTKAISFTLRLSYWISLCARGFSWRLGNE
jgi:hypothetical protein